MKSFISWQNTCQIRNMDKDQFPAVFEEKPTLKSSHQLEKKIAKRVTTDNEKQKKKTKAIPKKIT